MMEDNDSKYYIPRYLDEPIRLILWTWDEIAVFLVPLFLVYWLSNQLLLGIILGLAGFLGLKKLKGNQGHYFLKSAAYWYLPAMRQFRVTPPSYIREYIG